MTSQSHEYFESSAQVKLATDPSFVVRVIAIYDGVLSIKECETDEVVEVFGISDVSVKNEDKQITLTDSSKTVLIRSSNFAQNLQFWHRLQRAKYVLKHGRLPTEADFQADHAEVIAKCNSYIHLFEKQNIEVTEEPGKYEEYILNVSLMREVLPERNFREALYDGLNKTGYAAVLVKQFQTVRHLVLRGSNVSANQQSQLQSIYTDYLGIFLAGCLFSPTFVKTICESDVINGLVDDLESLLRQGLQHVRLNNVYGKVIALLLNWARTLEGKKQARELKITNRLHPLLKSPYKVVKISFYIIFSNLVDKTESDLMRLDEGFLEYYLKLLSDCLLTDGFTVVVDNEDGSRHYGYYMHVLLGGLEGLFLDGSNRKLLLHKGVLDLFERILDTNDTDSRRIILSILGQIADDKEFKDHFENNKDNMLKKIKSLSMDDFDLAEEATRLYKLLTGEDIPTAILDMGEESIQLYLKAVTRGSERTKDIRFMIVGHQGVGKTSLCLRLQDIVPLDVQKTNGIDIYTYSFIIDCDTGEWFKLEGTDIKNTMLKIGIMTKTAKETVIEEDSVSIKSIDKPSLSTNTSASFSENRTQTSNVEEIHNREKTLPKVMHDAGIDFGTQAGRSIESRPRANVLNIKETLKVVAGRSLPENYAFFSMFDFAGDIVYYATHQAFLTANAVYAVVIDFSKPIIAHAAQSGETGVSADILFWLRSIFTFSTTRDFKSAQSVPPILVIGTHKDKMPQKNEADKLKAARLTFLEFLNELGIEREIYQRTLDLYLIDNMSMESKDITAIKSKIVQLAKKQSYWNMEIPAKWIVLERELMIAKSQGIKFLSLDEVFEIDSKSESPIENKLEIRTCLRYFHAIGHILFFDGALSNLKEKVMIDLQWVSYAFREIIATPDYGKPEADIFKVHPLWQELQEHAFLKDEYLDLVWNSSTEDKYIDHKEDLVFIMERLSIITRPISMSSLPFELPDYIVPSMLKKPNLPLLLNQMHEARANTCTLCFVCRERYIPVTVFDKFIAACISKWPVSRTRENKLLLFRGCGCFTLDGPYVLLVFCFGNMIQAKIYKFSKKELRIDPEIVCGTREIIEEELTKQRNIFQHKQLMFDHHICLDPGEADARDMVWLEKLEEHKELFCAKDNSHIHLDDIRIWFQKDCKKRGQEVQVKGVFPEYILDETPTDKQLCLLTFQLGVPIPDLAKSLGLSDAESQHIQNDYQSSRERIFEVLLKWKNNVKTPSTLTFLMEKLHELQVDIKSVNVTAVFTEDAEVQYPGANIPPDWKEIIVTEKVCTSLSSKIRSDEWKMLGIILDLDYSLMTHIQTDHDQTAEKIYQMLIKWKHKYTINATLGKLASAMLQCSMSIECLRKET